MAEAQDPARKDDGKDSKPVTALIRFADAAGLGSGLINVGNGDLSAAKNVVGEILTATDPEAHDPREIAPDSIPSEMRELLERVLDKALRSTQTPSAAAFVRELREGGIPDRLAHRIDLNDLDRLLADTRDTVKDMSTIPGLFDDVVGTIRGRTILALARIVFHEVADVLDYPDLLEKTLELAKTFSAIEDGSAAAKKESIVAMIPPDRAVLTTRAPTGVNYFNAIRENALGEVMKRMKKPFKIHNGSVIFDDKDNITFKKLQEHLRKFGLQIKTAHTYHEREVEADSTRSITNFSFEPLPQGDRGGDTGASLIVSHDTFDLTLSAMEAGEEATRQVLIARAFLEATDTSTSRPESPDVSRAIPAGMRDILLAPITEILGENYDLPPQYGSNVQIIRAILSRPRPVQDLFQSLAGKIDDRLLKKIDPEELNTFLSNTNKAYLRLKASGSMYRDLLQSIVEKTILLIVRMLVTGFIEVIEFSHLLPETLTFLSSLKKTKDGKKAGQKEDISGLTDEALGSLLRQSLQIARYISTLHNTVFQEIMKELSLSEGHIEYKGNRVEYCGRRFVTEKSIGDVLGKYGLQCKDYQSEAKGDWSNKSQVVSFCLSPLEED